jgi:intracellular sulfur oxidation DsrE/DsrF family protein
MKKLLFLCLALVLIVQSTSFAQMTMPEHIKEKMTYPVLNFAPWVGVIPVVDPVMTYDPALTYKIAIDVYGTFKDSTKIYEPFTEIARTYNLFIANGVPADKIKIAAIVHGGLSRAVLSNAAFQEKYGIDNPTISALQELKKVGVEFYLCGQSMAFLQLPQEDITPEVKVAISAKTTFVALDQMGYTYLDVSGN